MNALVIGLALALQGILFFAMGYGLARAGIDIRAWLITAFCIAAVIAIFIAIRDTLRQERRAREPHTWGDTQ